MTALPLVPALAAAASALAAMTARTSGPGLMRAWEQYQNRHTVDQGAQQAAQEAAKQDDKAEGVGTGLSPVDPKEPCGDCGDEKKKKRNTRAADRYRNDPNSLKGRSFEDVENELDRELRDGGGWDKGPIKNGEGVRYLDHKGNSVIINQGYPEGLQSGEGDLLHQGPYVKIQPGDIRIPLRRGGVD